MLKRIGLGLLVLIGALVVGGGIYLFTQLKERPKGDAPVTEQTFQDAYKGQGAARDWLLAIYKDNPKLPALSAAVGVEGQLVWAGAVGYADVSKKTPVALDSVFPIGSISKSITAVVAVRLHQKGALDLNAPFNTIVPDFAGGNASYSLKHLLSNQSGIRHYDGTFSESFNEKEYASTREAAAYIENDPLLFVPGDGFKYSTYGFTVAALGMETAAGKPYEPILTEQVLSPAGMTATRLDKVGLKDDKRVTPYMVTGEFLMESFADNVSHKYAGGGWLSTPSDLVRFGNALIGDGILNADSKVLLWTPVPLANGAMNPEYYALGFRTGEDDLGRFVHHGGTSAGGYSFLLIYPEAGIVVALTTNYAPEQNGFDRLAQAQALAHLYKR